MDREYYFLSFDDDEWIHYGRHRLAEDAPLLNLECRNTKPSKYGKRLRGHAFDDRAVQSIDIHASLGIGTRDRNSTHTYCASRSITRQASCHANSAAQPAGNGHQAQHCGSQHYTTHRDALQQSAPRITISFTPTPSCTLVNALRPDIRGVPEPCHTIHNHITAFVTSEFDDSLVPLHFADVPVSQFSTVDGALCG
ncbi:hypothetical protein DFJ58DRAFT_730634 [Suillus subalutaceus]|uniref:uncharacterized protein n=1 Tax=Suillus subalutaceus TaxID=48586 RepID=UPI001B882D87|nr:uncharacterized protein DFJ58DRAFT_730634 [Suillus subalutaceus]KAG1846048.1 hypothetical protein DFJ58DRAFT_730634 [Suillus subalutaceus]